MKSSNSQYLEALASCAQPYVTFFNHHEHLSTGLGQVAMAGGLTSSTEAVLHIRGVRASNENDPCISCHTNWWSFRERSISTAKLLASFNYSQFPHISFYSNIHKQLVECLRCSFIR